MMAEIRTLHSAEVPAAAQLLARAMRDDPMHKTVFGPDAHHRLGRLTCFFSLLLPQMSEAPLAAWEADRLVGVLGFFPPGTCRPPVAEQVRIAYRLLSPNVGELWRLWRWLHACAEQDPRERHWHLAAVAVDVDQQRRGVGSQMLQALCATMDDSGEVAFLETDKPESVRFYARFGFEVTAKADVLGTPNWWMRRPASRSRSTSSRNRSRSGVIRRETST
jgi:predicted N-acetyltransferase YhbS